MQNIIKQYVDHMQKPVSGREKKPKRKKALQSGIFCTI